MDSRKLTLSRGILQMKFMKRTKDKVEKQQFQEEGEEYFSSQFNKSCMKNSFQKFFTEPSYVFCEELADGRLSFQGMNPNIEKLMEARENAKQTKLEAKQETDISDEQMAVHWEKMRIKFDKQRHRKTQHRKTKTEGEPTEKKPKFLKPVD